jgi:hypothetical protein
LEVFRRWESLIDRDGGSAPCEVRMVYMGDPKLGADGLVPMFPFAVRMRASASEENRENRFFFCETMEYPENPAGGKDGARTAALRMRIWLPEASDDATITLSA